MCVKIGALTPSMASAVFMNVLADERSDDEGGDEDDDE